MASEKQVWLITGASRGIGYELAKAALNVGHAVVACYRSKPQDASQFDELEKLGGTWLQLDVSADDVEDRVREGIAIHGKVDVLVNNAGYGILSTVEDAPIDKTQAIFATNFLGPLRTTQAVLPAMRARGSGSIVNVSSTNGFKSLPALGIYSATKFALEAMTEALAAEVAPFGIRALLVEPGAVRTDFSSAADFASGVQVPLGAPYAARSPDDGHPLNPAGFFADYCGSEQFLANATPPAPLARRMVEAVDGTGLFAAGRKVEPGVVIRVPLGRDAGTALEDTAKYWAELAREGRAFCGSAAEE
ncbi:putative short chain oxidoreductase/dehydrogenase [Xylariomycetidae sp. FL0641]|nr:putative short chain oxidoreductase/dehydrogenase [Xylariomycetidae sp. FL0641]